MDHIVRKAIIENELHSYNINREGGFCLSIIIEATYRLPRNFRDMIQVYLATRLHILKAAL
jgi:hypothetical protein